MGAGAASERLTSYPRNPAYGTGVCRRRICFAASPGRMTVSLFDDFHDMVVEIDHDGVSVTGIAGEMRRYPKTTCPGAAALLQQFVGCVIAEGRNAVVGRFPRGAHCTHLIDLAALGISALQRGVQDECIEMAVADPDAEGRQSVSIEVDGEERLAFTIQNERLATPAAYAGQSLFGGFTRWADERFSGFERDLWQMAQMAVFISHGRAYIVDGTQQMSAKDEPHRKGACFSYSDPSFETALDMVGYVRDHTGGLPPRDRARERTGGVTS